MLRELRLKIWDGLSSRVSFAIAQQATSRIQLALWLLALFGLAWEGGDSSSGKPRNTVSCSSILNIFYAICDTDCSQHYATGSDGAFQWVQELSARTTSLLTFRAISSRVGHTYHGEILY